MLSRRPGKDGPAASASRWWKGAAIAAAVLPMFLFVISATIEYRDHVATTRERLLRGIDILYEHGKKVFETEQLTAAQVDEMLVSMPDAAIRENEQSLHLRLKTLVERLPQLRDIWVIDRDGRPLVSAEVYPLPKGLDLSNRRYFQELKDGRIPNGGLYVSSVLRGRADPSQIFFQAATRRMSGLGPGIPFSGVIAISVDPRYFRDFYAQVAHNDLSMLVLARADGAILARYPPLAKPATRLPRISTFMKAISQAPDRGYYLGNSFFEPKDRYIAYRKIAGDPVYVAIGIDRHVVLLQWISAMAQHLIFGLPATLLLCGLTLTAYKRARNEEAAWARFREEVLRREQVEAQLRQAQKLESIGRLTGGIAHDFNNLMTIVSGSLELLQRRMKGLQPSETRLLSTALGGAERASRLTHRLLAFSRQQALEPRSIEANRLVGGMSELLRRTLGELIEIQTRLADDLWTIRVDPHQLENALINLAVNARDAMPAGGRLVIETANVELGADYAAREQDVAPGSYVMVAVTDTGAGMTPDVIANAFDPFFTTKSMGAGTGLGLSQVFGFVKQSEGHVKIYSQPGHGTSVKMYFPQAVSAEQEEPVAGPSADESGGGELVVVVEDEIGVRRFTVEALHDLGFVALEAADGESALRLLAEHPEARLLLTDVVMPGMDGRRLAEAVATRFPRVKVLFMTGYSRNALLDGDPALPAAHVLTKPFTIARLSAKIDEVLGAPVNSSAAE